MQQLLEAALSAVARGIIQSPESASSRASTQPSSVTAQISQDGQRGIHGRVAIHQQGGPSLLFSGAVQFPGSCRPRFHPYSYAQPRQLESDNPSTSQCRLRNASARRDGRSLPSISNQRHNIDLATTQPTECETIMPVLASRENPGCFTLNAKHLVLALHFYLQYENNAAIAQQFQNLVSAFEKIDTACKISLDLSKTIKGLQSYTYFITLIKSILSDSPGAISMLSVFACVSSEARRVKDKIGNISSSNKRKMLTASDPILNYLTARPLTIRNQAFLTSISTENQLDDLNHLKSISTGCYHGVLAYQLATEQTLHRHHFSIEFSEDTAHIVLEAIEGIVLDITIPKKMVSILLEATQDIICHQESGYVVQ